MEKNGVISLRLEDLVEMLDARKTVNIISEKESVKICKVYELLADPEFLKTYGKKKVIGVIYCTIYRTFNILKVFIEEV